MDVCADTLKRLHLRVIDELLEHLQAQLATAVRNCEETVASLENKCVELDQSLANARPVRLNPNPVPSGGSVADGHQWLADLCTARKAARKATEEFKEITQCAGQCDDSTEDTIARAKSILLAIREVSEGRQRAIEAVAQASRANGLIRRRDGALIGGASGPGPADAAGVA